MKPRLIIALAAVVAIVVCASWLWRDEPARSAQASATPPPGAPARSEPHRGFAAPANATTAEESALASPKPGTEKSSAMPFGEDLFSRKITTEDIRKFLALRGETAANLVVAYEAAQDFQWLERAEQLFPNNPLVLEALITSKLQPEKLAERIARFKAADGNNPLPWIFSAEQMFKAHDPAAKEELEAALSRPGFYTYTKERTDASRALFESMGWAPLDAEARSVFGLPIPQMSTASSIGKNLMELQKTAAESGDQAESGHLLQLTYDLGKMFSTPEASRFLIGQLVGYSLERKALDAMPADQSLPSGGTVADRLAELDRMKEQTKTMMQTSEAAIAGDPALRLEYLQRVRTYGETIAMRWLQQRKQK